MVEFHKGFENFEKLGSGGKEKSGDTAKPEELSLSKHIETDSLLKPAADFAASEAFYQSTRDFVIKTFDMVKTGKEDDIQAKDIITWAESTCDWLMKYSESDDLVRLAFKHDEYEPNYIYSHSANVFCLSAHLAVRLSFSRTRLQELIIASLFHDIGMMKIPETVWNNTHRLTTHEYEEVQKHSLHGEGIFTNLSDIDAAVPLVIAQHQEKNDGSGYPGHLSKNHIHYLARLVSLVDMFEALTHTRFWRARFLPDKAFQQLLDKESESYDPYFMKALLRYVTMFPVGTWVKISSGEVGNIVKANPDTPLRPVVNLILDRHSKRLGKPQVLDLSKQLLLHVEECLDTSKLSI